MRRLSLQLADCVTDHGRASRSRGLRFSFNRETPLYLYIHPPSDRRPDPQSPDTEPGPLLADARLVSTSASLRVSRTRLSLSCPLTDVESLVSRQHGAGNSLARRYRSASPLAFYIVLSRFNIVLSRFIYTAHGGRRQIVRL